MKDKTLKLNLVQVSINVFKDMLKFEREQEKKWSQKEGRELIAYACQKAGDAYEFVINLLEKDLEDKDEKFGVED